MNDRLKPCPFCGSNNLTFAQSNEYDDKISCCDCNAFMPRFRNKDKTTIIAAWNRRPAPHKYTLEEVKELAEKPYYHVGEAETGWAILPERIAKHPTDYKFGETWVAYDRPPEEEDNV